MPNDRVAKDTIIGDDKPLLMETDSSVNQFFYQTVSPQFKTNFEENRKTTNPQRPIMPALLKAKFDLGLNPLLKRNRLLLKKPKKKRSYFLGRKQSRELTAGEPEIKKNE